MKAVSQTIVLLLATAAAHAADKTEPPAGEACAVAHPMPEATRTDRLDPAVIERMTTRQRAPKMPAFPAEQR
ncbi:hypothetical protein [Roseateles sp. BYS96W]|uniref:Uncharacterized protein n=1 Tax=Pelomonas nitida TaxID=3299027 RepID=A0ABW7G875_9BURK